MIVNKCVTTAIVHINVFCFELFVLFFFFGGGGWVWGGGAENKLRVYIGGTQMGMVLKPFWFENGC